MMFRRFTFVAILTVLFLSLQGASALMAEPRADDEQVITGLLENERQSDEAALTGYQIRLNDRIRKLQKKVLEVERVMIAGFVLILGAIGAAAVVLRRTLRALPNPPPDAGGQPPGKNGARSGRPLASIVLLFFSIGFSILMIEGGSRAYFAVTGSGEYTDKWAFRAARPAPYENASYFGSDFLLESRESINVTQVPGTRFFRHHDFSGRYINVAGGKRVTTGQPAEYQRRVWLFGGSTIFSFEVPDAMTVASYLQQLLNRRQPNYWRVENVGTIGMNSAQQLERLRHEAIGNGDIVIFYDGVNDVVFGLYYKNEEGMNLGQRGRAPVRELNWIQKTMSSINRRFGENWAAVRLAFNVYVRPNVLPPDWGKKLRTEAPRLAERYRDTLLETERVVSDAGARFMHFLQPTIFSKDNLTPYEHQLIQDPLAIPTGMGQAFDIAYDHIRPVLAEMREKGVDTVDLSGSFDPVTAKFGDVFLDFCHTNHVANAVIALEMFKHIGNLNDAGRRANLNFRGT